MREHLIEFIKAVNLKEGTHLKLGPCVPAVDGLISLSFGTSCYIGSPDNVLVYDDTGFIGEVPVGEGVDRFLKANGVG